MAKVILGYIHSFEIFNEKNKSMFGPHPKIGSIYRVLEDGGEYRLHVGYANTHGKYNGIFLGATLVGNYMDHWSYNIEEVTKDNISQFELSVEDLLQAKQWLTSSHEDILPDVTPQQQAFKVEELDKEEAVPKEALDALLSAEKYFAEQMSNLSGGLNKIVSKDRYFTIVVAQLIHFLGTTYDDKYEATGDINYAKEFLLSRKTPDATMFNAMKYIQRYSTEGFEKSRNTRDIQKAIHYLLFELQRSFIQNQTDEQKNFGA